MSEAGHNRVLGSKALGILRERRKNGTLREVFDDWKWIFTYTRRYRVMAVGYGLLGIASASLGLVSAVAGKYAIDIITGYQRSQLGLLLVLMAVSSVLSLLLRSAISRVSARVTLRVNNDIQAEVFDRILEADWAELNGYSSGDLLSRLNTDAVNVAGNAINWLPDLVIAVYTFAATLVVIVYYDWVMALLALASAPFLLLSSQRLMGKMRYYNQEVRKAGSDLMAYESETFRNLDTIKGFGVTARYGRAMRQRQDDYRQLSLRYNLFGIRTEAALSVLGMAVQMAAFLYCLYLLWTGKILYGTMTLFLTQGGKLTSSFHSLVRTVPNFLNASVSAHRIRELNRMEPERPAPCSDAVTARAAKGLTVSMEEVSFAYKPDHPVLEHVSFSAAPGEIVALIGPSGGGKTTMIRLMLGLIRPTAGRAYLQADDGQQAEMNTALRSCYSYVPQGNTMISGTVAENLRMVRPNAAESELEQALRDACAWDFVSQMPGGVNGLIGENGHGLSEGQAQRIAIARALLRDAPVLLLDEATSALDVATERQLLRNVMRVHPGKTCIVTTHRPSVLSLCSRIYQVADGRVTELTAAQAEKLTIDY